MDTLSVYYVWSFFVRSRRRGFCDWNERQTLGTHPDFIAMNYYSTATIGVSREMEPMWRPGPETSRLCWMSKGCIK